MGFGQLFVYDCVVLDLAVFFLSEEAPVVSFAVFSFVFLEVGELVGEGC